MYKFSSQHPGDPSKFIMLQPQNSSNDPILTSIETIQGGFTCHLDSLLHVCSCLNVCKDSKSEVTMAQLPLATIVYNSGKRGSNPTSHRSIMNFIVQQVIKAEFQQLKDGLLRFSRGMLTFEL